MAQRRQTIDAVIAAELTQPVSGAVAAAAAEVRRRHGAAVAAILFYGSCLRDGDDSRVIDFYALVERYRDIYQGVGWSVLNTLLPPNVYYLSVPHDGRTVRVKYAVISLPELARGTTGRAFQSALWGRFSQPATLVWARDADVERRVAVALAAAVETMCAEVVGLMPRAFSPDELWIRAFAESYRTEFRAERSRRPDQLYQAFADRYDRLTEILLADGGLPDCAASSDREGRIVHRAPARARRRAAAKWGARRVTGKALHVLRLAKAVFTFRDGLDYLLWKIETHSGVSATVSSWQRRHPLLAAPLLAWQLYRRGAFR